jgi:hypothetical protein
MYSVKTPEVVNLVTLFPDVSMNQRLRSGPTAIPAGLLADVGMVSVSMIATDLDDGAPEDVPSQPTTRISAAIAAANSNVRDALRLISGNQSTEFPGMRFDCRHVATLALAIRRGEVINATTEKALLKALFARIRVEGNEAAPTVPAFRAPGFVLWEEWWAAVDSNHLPPR